MKLFAFLSILALTAAPAAFAETVANTRVPLGGSVTNPCNGEDVALAGDAHLVAHITADGNGGLHAGIHVNANLKGTGASGANYNGHAVANGQLNATSGGAAEGTLVLNIGLIGQGKAPNFKLKVTLHLTVNANGDLTATVLKLVPSCN